MPFEQDARAGGRRVHSLSAFARSEQDGFASVGRGFGRRPFLLHPAPAPITKTVVSASMSKLLGINCVAASRVSFLSKCRAAKINEADDSSRRPQRSRGNWCGV